MSQVMSGCVVITEGEAFETLVAVRAFRRGAAGIAAVDDCQDVSFRVSQRLFCLIPIDWRKMSPIGIPCISVTTAALLACAENGIRALTCSIESRSPRLHDP